MFATIENVKVIGCRPLPPRAPRPGQNPKDPECEVQVMVDGSQGVELVKLKAPFTDMTDFLTIKDSGKIIESLPIIVTEYEIDGRKGVSYRVRASGQK